MFSSQITPPFSSSSSSSMATTTTTDHSFSSSNCLLGTMDRLWFHQIICVSPDTASSASASASLLFGSSDQVLSEFSVLQDQETSSDSLSGFVQDQEQEGNNSDSSSLDSLITTTTNTGQQDDGHKLERPTRLNLDQTKRTRSLSSSPSTQKHHHHHPKSLRHTSSSSSLVSTNMATLEKSMSCKTLRELELEEVKGFMDLGFIFNKEDLTSRMVTLVPGLAHKSNKLQNPNKPPLFLDEDLEVVDEDDDDEDEDVVKMRAVMRPYLSEAWLIKKPDSPLLNLRVPRVSNSSAHDMKKHLRFWAKTVALVMHQESS